MKTSTNKSAEKNRQESNKNAKMLNDALNKLVAGGMSLGSLAKNIHQEEEPSREKRIDSPLIAEPLRHSPQLPNPDGKHPRATRAKIKIDDLDDADNSDNSEINVATADIRGKKSRKKSDKLMNAIAPNTDRVDSHQKIENANNQAKSYSVDMKKLFDWAKFYKNSLRFKGEKQKDKELDCGGDNESQNELSECNAIHENEEFCDDAVDSDNLSDIEDQMLTMYLLVIRGLRRFKSVERKLQNYLEKSRQR